MRKKLNTSSPGNQFGKAPRLIQNGRMTIPAETPEDNSLTPLVEEIQKFVESEA